MITLGNLSEKNLSTESSYCFEMLCDRINYTRNRIIEDNESTDNDLNICLKKKKKKRKESFLVRSSETIFKRPYFFLQHIVTIMQKVPTMFLVIKKKIIFNSFNTVSVNEACPV